MLVDFNTYLVAPVPTPVISPVDFAEEPQPGQRTEEKVTYNLFQYWNFLDDALLDVRKQAEKAGGTSQQEVWLTQ